VKAESSDRQAKLKLKRKIEDNTEYQALPTKKAKSVFMETQFENLEQKRASSQSSGEL
jgi:hypothetical protein